MPTTCYQIKCHVFAAFLRFIGDNLQLLKVMYTCIYFIIIMIMCIGSGVVCATVMFMCHCNVYVEPEIRGERVKPTDCVTPSHSLYL
jgi:hypothetical protein